MRWGKCCEFPPLPAAGNSAALSVSLGCYVTPQRKSHIAFVSAHPLRFDDLIIIAFHTPSSYWTSLWAIHGTPPPLDLTPDLEGNGLRNERSYSALLCSVPCFSGPGASPCVLHVLCYYVLATYPSDQLSAEALFA